MRRSTVQRILAAVWGSVFLATLVFVGLVCTVVSQERRAPGPDVPELAIAEPAARPSRPEAAARPAAPEPEQLKLITADALWSKLRFDFEGDAHEYLGRYILVAGYGRPSGPSSKDPDGYDVAAATATSLAFDSDNGGDIIFATISPANAKSFGPPDHFPNYWQERRMIVRGRCCGLSRGYARKVYMDDVRRVEAAP